MSLSIGIIGLPNVGKSTLFQALTKKEVSRENYPFCTIDPNIGVVAVPDERVDKLAELIGVAKRIYTTIEFVDIAGLVKGANKGEGLGNKFLANIREVDAIVYVLRCFANKDIVNIQETIDVLEDKSILDIEMAMKDLETVQKRIQKLEKEVRTKGKGKEIEKELSVLERVRDLLERGRFLSEEKWSGEEKKALNNYQLLTMKERLFLLNGSDSEVASETIEVFKKNDWPFLVMDVLTEFEAVDFSAEERISFGLPRESKLDALIKKCYKILDLITFFTINESEVRAWTLEKGQKAPQAGGIVHSDFETHFIKAEVINWKELVECGSFAKAREKGLVRTEGKDYVVQDGDIIEIKADV